jgi:hypothetical protein
MIEHETWVPYSAKQNLKGMNEEIRCLLNQMYFLTPEDKIPISIAFLQEAGSSYSSAFQEENIFLLKMFSAD